MHHRDTRWRVLGWILATSIAVAACASDETAATTTGTTQSGGAGGSGGQSGGNGGQGGTGGSGPSAHGPAAVEFVNAGATVTSPGYKLVLAFGQSSPIQGRVDSPNHRLRGGIVGAEGGLQ